MSVIELVEILRTTKQGMTMPLICKADNGKTYYVKGKRATATGLIKEWLAAHLAKSFSLPIPNFEIAYMDEQLVYYDGSEAVDNVGAGYVFASEYIHYATDFKYSHLKNIEENQLRDLLLFDLWIENADRTLSEDYSGNPNLLWDSRAESFYIIDHNLAFDVEFNRNDFWQTHVCHDLFQVRQRDMIEDSIIEQRMQQSLSQWSEWWAKIPDEWQEQNDEMRLFNAQNTLQRLTDDALGGIWSKF